MNRSIIILLCILSCLLASMFSCSDPEPLKIGFLASMSGRNSGLGQSARDGVFLAVERLNAEGGLQGRKVEVVLFDAQFDADQAVEGVKLLHEKGVAAIVGPVASQMALAIVPTADSLKIPVISPTATTPDLSNLKDYFFRIYPSLEKNAGTLADYAVMKQGLKRLAVICDTSNKSFTLPWKNSFKQKLTELSAEVVHVTEFNSKQAPLSYGDIIEQALLADPDGLLVLANALDTALICQQVRKQGSPISLMGSDWSYAGDLIQFGGKTVEGFIFTTGVNMHDLSPAFLKFKKDYADRYGLEPNFPAVLSYEATSYLLKALAKAGNLETLPEKLVSLGPFAGLQGQIVLNEFGDVSRTVFINEIRNGKFNNLAQIN